MTEPEHAPTLFGDAASPTGAGAGSPTDYHKGDPVPAPEPSSAPVTSTRWEPLPPLERRVLGVLVEKQKTVSYIYPLSMTHLVIGCNQKQNRDPVIQTNEDELEAVLEALIQKGLVEPVHGGRVIHYRHKLYEKWTPDAKELAILAELLLRGAQSRGLLRARASRMDRIDTVQELDAILGRMAERGLIVYLSPPGRRGTVVTHGFHTPEELTHLRQHMPTGEEDEATDSDAASSRTVSVPGTTTSSSRRATATAVDALQEQLTHLTAIVQQLQERLAALEAKLGTTPTESS